MACSVPSVEECHERGPYATVARLASRYEPRGEDVTAAMSDPAPEYAARCLGAGAVRAAIQDAVIPWVLGYDDPLAPGA